MKAKDEVKRMITNTLKQKLAMPLQTIVKAGQNFLQAEELQKFELMIGNTKISKQMKQMITYCKLVSLRLDDMQDMMLITEFKLVLRTSQFDCWQMLVNLR